MIPTTPLHTTQVPRGRAVAHVSGFWIGYLVVLGVFGVLRGFLSPHIAPLAWGGASTLGLLGLTRWLLRRGYRAENDVGLGWSFGTLRRFAVGLVLGTAVYATILLMVAVVAGPLTVIPVTAPPNLAFLTAVATTLALAIMEEVGFRGYPLWTLVGPIGKWWAQAVVAVAFALVHILYGWSLSSVLFGVFPSGLLFGAVALATRGIACPLGVHIALNLCQALTSGTGDLAVWRVGMRRGSESMVAADAPIIGFVVVMLAAVAVTLWAASRAKRSHLAAA